MQRILVVEDSEDCAATIDIALGLLDRVETVVVSSAEEALRTIEDGSVSLLITDIHLPAMSGLELVDRVRQDPRHAALPILVISGDSDTATPERVRSAGATAFFRKPYSPVAVRRKVEELIHAL